MQPREVIAWLSGVGGRAAGTDGERRAAAWLRDVLRTRGERVSYETVWVRPYWAACYALHAAMGVAGSVVSVPVPAAGLAILGVALGSLVGDLSGWYFLLRRLTPRRATQNVVAGPADSRPPRTGAQTGGRTRLVLVANVDSGHCGNLHRDAWVRVDARLRRMLAGRLPSPLALIALTTALLLALVAARAAGGSGTPLGALQLAPTLLLAIAFLAFTDIALSEAAPGANANASGVATALTVLEALRREPPSQLDVHLLLAGAGEPGALGVRAFLTDRRRRLAWRAENVAVIALEPCGVGRPRYFTHEGALIAAPLHPELVAHARALAQAERHLGALPYRDHRAGAAHAARRIRWPSIALGALDTHDRPGRARQRHDVPATIDDAALHAMLEFTLALIARLDASLRGSAARPRHTELPT